MMLMMALWYGLEAVLTLLILAGGVGVSWLAIELVKRAHSDTTPTN